MRSAPLALALLALGCSSGAPPRGAPPLPPIRLPPLGSGLRVAAVPPTDPAYARVEGIGLRNGCAVDEDCHRGGCSREVCSADPAALTTCEVRPWPQGAAWCGCLSGVCSWYRVERTARRRDLWGQGMPCEQGRCAGGLRCLTPPGDARRPPTCELPCGDGRPCPPDQRCIALPGLGPVCRWRDEEP